MKQPPVLVSLFNTVLYLVSFLLMVLIHASHFLRVFAKIIGVAYVDGAEEQGNIIAIGMREYCTNDYDSTIRSLETTLHDCHKYSQEPTILFPPGFSSTFPETYRHDFEIMSGITIMLDALSFFASMTIAISPFVPCLFSAGNLVLHGAAFFRLQRFLDTLQESLHYSAIYKQVLSISNRQFQDFYIKHEHGYNVILATVILQLICCTLVGIDTVLWIICWIKNRSDTEDLQQRQERDVSSRNCHHEIEIQPKKSANMHVPFQTAHVKENPPFSNVAQTQTAPKPQPVIYYGLTMNPPIPTIDPPPYSEIFAQPNRVPTCTNS